MAANAPTDAPEPEGLVQRSAGLRRFLAMPAFLMLVCAGLYLAVSRRELDDIERRVLTADSLTDATIRHLELVGVSTIAVIALAVPLGILLTRPFARGLTPPVVGVANIGQAVPSIGVIVLLGLTLGIGFRYAVYALVLYAFLPVLRNTMIGLQRVDPAVIESGRGMGMTRLGVLRRIELPLAVPVILAGIRTALVINVGTATLAVFTGAGGLGAPILSGITLNRTVVLLTGSILVAVLALALDYVAGLAEELLRPRGL